MNDFMRSNGETGHYVVETRSSLMACQLAIDGAGIAVFDRMSAHGLDLSGVTFRPLEPERWITFGTCITATRSPPETPTCSSSACSALLQTSESGVRTMRPPWSSSQAHKVKFRA